MNTSSISDRRMNNRTAVWNVSRTGVRRFALGCAALVLAAGSATAQVKPETPVPPTAPAAPAPAQSAHSQQGQVRAYYPAPRPGETQAAAAGQGGLSGDGMSGRIISMSASKGSDTYTLEVEGGRLVRAEVNGKEIPRDRVKRQGESVTLLDENGKELHRFDLPAARGGNAVTVWRSAPAAPAAPGIQWREPLDPANVPPVMLGITMTDTDQGTRIDSVMPGSPAAKAGLKPGDIVNEVGGKKIAGTEGLRAAMRERKPGDKVSLDIIRDGQAVALEAELVAYNETLMTRRMPELNNLNGMMIDRGEAALEEAAAMVERAMKEFADNPALQPDNIKARANEALRQAQQGIEKARAGLAARINSMSESRLRMFLDGSGAVISPPAPPAINPELSRQNADLSRQLEALTQQIQELNKRLDSIDQRLPSKVGGSTTDTKERRNDR